MSALSRRKFMRNAAGLLVPMTLGMNPASAGIISMAGQPLRRVRAAGHVAPSSTPITGLTFDYTTWRREASGSDNWPGCAAGNGKHYVFWGDGVGFDAGGNSSLGIASLTGAYDSFVGADVYGSGIDGKCHGQPICMSDDTIYFWFTPGSGTNGFTSSTLYKTTDYGANVSAVSPQVQFTHSTHNIAYLGFINYGVADAESDGYVYIVACDITDTSSTTAPQDDLMLLRVATADIETQASYEWYTSSDPNNPTWGAFASRQPIYSVTNGMSVYGCKPCWIPTLNRICMPVEYGTRISDFKFYDAPKPWGPYTLVGTFPSFGVGETGSDTGGELFQMQFLPGFFRNSGLDFTVTMSGDNYDDAFESVDGSFLTS